MISVLGAGPAGLSSAFHLDPECVIYEREATAGGLCRSTTLAGTVFDLGGHAFFSKHAEVHTLLADLGVEVFAQPRNAVVYSHGNFVPYPFQHNLYGLPTDVVAACVSGALAADASHTDRPARDMREWIIRSFGTGIADHFLIPYNEKVWAFPLDEISPTWTDDRVVRADAEAVLRGARQRSNYDEYPNAVVRYPAHGGFCNLFEPLIRELSPKIVHRDVHGLDLDRRDIIFADGGRAPYEDVISTIPLTDLVNRSTGVRECCRAAASELRFNSLYLVNLVYLNTGERTAWQRVYCASPDICFHKLVMNSNSSPELRSSSCFGFQAEVSFSRHKNVDAGTLIEQVQQALRAMHLVEPMEEPLAAELKVLPYAYPVYTRRTDSARAHLLSALEERNVLCAGRFGEWLYINSDVALMRGRARAQQLNERG